MAKRPHVKLNTQAQQEAPVVLRFNYGPISSIDDEDKNYLPMVESFRNSMRRLITDRSERAAERNPDLAIPANIEYIQIVFQGPFNLEGYNQVYYNEFGLEVVSLSEFNRKVLFSVIDNEKFNLFLVDIEHFILKESVENERVEYRGRVKYIRAFKLLTTADILDYQELLSLMNFQLTELGAGSVEWNEIFDSLRTYLTRRRLDHQFIEEANVLEISAAPPEVIAEIARNFDIVQSVTSSLSTVVRPSTFNVVERGYGFEVGNPDEDLPIIGILDTGINSETPLGPIIIRDDSFNLTGSSPLVDLADDGYGHGTAVAALAALGRRRAVSKCTLRAFDILMIVDN